MPTQAELYERYYKQKKTNFKDENYRKLEEKYGNQDNIKLPSNILEGESEEYVEYYESGKVKNTNNQMKVITSKYPEDVHQYGHTSIWGSYYHDDFGWGYRCCLSFDRNITCPGKSGRETNQMKIEQHDLEKKKREDEEYRAKNEEKLKREEAGKDKGIFDEMMERIEKHESNQLLTKKIEREKDKSISLDK